MNDDQMIEAIRRALRDAAVPRLSYTAMVDGDDPKIMIQGVYSVYLLVRQLHRELAVMT